MQSKKHFKQSKKHFKQSKKHFKQNKKTLKNKINKYICKKKDICCEDDIDRKLAIQNIF